MDKARIKAPERPLNKHPNHFEYRNIITEMHPKPVIFLSDLPVLNIITGSLVDSGCEKARTYFFLWK